MSESTSGVPAVRAVLAVTGRGDLAFAPLHKRPLLHHAHAALVDAFGAGVVVVADAADHRRTRAALRHDRPTVVDPAAWRESLAAGAGPVLVHDPLCPLVTSEFLREVVEVGTGGSGGVVAFRPVTDTVKQMTGRDITGTVDREKLATVSSPLLLPADAVAATDDPPPLEDATRLTAWLHRHAPVTMHRAPSLGRRIDDLSSLLLLECLDEVRRRTRTA